MSSTKKGTRVVAGNARSHAAKTNLRMGTAIAGALALGALFPSAAWAQNECGAPVDGTVTCSPDGNPYPNGVSYVATPGDLTIVLEDGVVIDTTGGLNNGVLALGIGDNAITVDGETNTSITTTASGANGILGATTDGALTLTADQIDTSGANASGIFASSATGLTTVSANNISTAGVNADGVSASTNSGDIVVFADTITTTGNGAKGVRARSDNGDVIIFADSISTTGNAAGLLDPGANGILATTGGTGNIDVVAGTVETTGTGAIGVRAQTFNGTASVVADSVTTSGLNASGISVNATGATGMGEVIAGTIATAGTNAHGIVAIGGGGVDLTFDAITTTGDNAVGVLVPAAAPFQGIRTTPTIVIGGGDITTSGQNADGIRAFATDSVNFDLNGDITTSGDGARGVFVTAPNGVTITGTSNITTSGESANGVDVSSLAGPIDLTVGDVTTSGNLSGGVRAVGGTDSDVSVTTGNVTTTGLAGNNYAFLPNSTAIVATAIGTGSVLVDAGDVSTAGLGAAGVNATAALGDALVSTGDVSTLGDRANGVTAQSAGGDVLVSTGNIDTTGTNSAGVYAVAGAGSVTVDVDNVTTEGSNASGVDAIGGAGGVDVGFVAVDVGGTFSSGVSAISIGGDVVVSGADITTTGTSNYALYAASDVGNVDVTTTGDVSSTGRSNTGIVALSGTGDVSVSANNVTVAAADPGDTATNRGAIFAQGANADVVVTGAVSTTGSALYGGSADAVTVVATTGDANVSVVDVSTTGTRADAVDVSAIAGNATLDASGLVSTTGNNSRGIVITSGQGTTITGGGDVSTTGNNAFAVTATSTGGPVDVTVGDVSTAGGNSDGVSVRSVGVFDATVVTGNVTTTNTGFGSRGVSVLAGAGDISVTTGNVSTAGIGAPGIYASSAGGLTTVNAGNVSTSGSGNAILARGGQGVDVTFASASTSGNYSSAISAVTSGPVRITGGAVTTSGNGSDGITAISFDDNVNVTTTGMVMTTGTNARGVFAQSYAGNTVVDVNGASTSGAATDAVVATSGQAVTVINRGTITTTGAGSNGIVATSTTGSTIVNTGNLSAANLALIATGGPATVTNSGTLRGRIQLTGGNDTLANSGTFALTGDSDFGAGTDSLTNTGTITTGLTTAGTVRFLGLETLTNSGLIELRNGRTGDILSTSGNYIGSNGRLGVDANLTTNVADRLVIGGSATGSTSVFVNRIDTGPITLGTNTTIVQTGAGSQASAFILDPTQVDQGLIQLGIVFDPTNSTFNIQAAPGAAVFRTGAFAGAVRNLWLQSADAWSGHMRGLRDNIAANGPGGSGGRVWAQAYGQKEELAASRAITVAGITTVENIGTDQDYFGGQMGIDLGGAAGEGGFAFGVTGGYLNSTLGFDGTADRINFDVVNVGAYASYTSGVFFVNALGKYDYYWGDVSSTSGRFTTDMNGSIYGAKAEVGARIGGAFWVEPAASIAYTKVDMDDIDTAQGNFRFDADEGLRGKAGARVGYTFETTPGTQVQAYVGGNYVHEFQGRDRVSFVSGGQTVSFTNDRIDDYGEATVGVNIGSQSGAISGFFEGRYANGGDYEGYGGRAGLRFRF